MTLPRFIKLYGQFLRNLKLALKGREKKARVDDKLKQKQSRGIECCIDEVVIEMFEANCF